MTPTLHVTGEILVGANDIRTDLWVIDGRVTFERPESLGDVESVTGWVLPGLVDAHCHIGIDSRGPTLDRESCEAQAYAVRDSGTLLIRDAGSPADTRWIDDRDDLPKIVRAGRHIARARRYIRGLGHEIGRASCRERV